jgi:surface antigen
MTYPFKTLTRALTLTTAALAMTAALSIASPGIAHADQSRWSNGHGHKVDRHLKKRRLKQYRKQHRWQQRRHWRMQRRSHRHYTTTYETGSSNTGGSFDFLKGINGGHIIGGLLGAATGTQFGKGSGRTVAVLGGAILGAVLGGNVSKSIQDADKRNAQSVLETTPAGQTVSWKNPDTGAAYTVTPTRTYQQANGRYCRDYTTWVFIDGYEEIARGTACRTPNGAWAPQG